MSEKKPMPWVKIWTDMPWDHKIRQLDTYAKWIWTVILCLARRSPKAGDLLTKEIDDFGKPIEDTPYRPATISDLAKVARIRESDWRPEYETKFTGTMREIYTRVEFLVYVAIEQFKALDMILEKDLGDGRKVFVVKNFPKRQYRDICPDQDISPSGQSEEKEEGEEKRNKTKERKKTGRRGPGSGVPRTEESLAIYEVYEYWLKVMDKPRSMLTQERRKKILARLNEGYSVEDLKKAIDGCRASPFHMGENERQTVYNDICLICRNGSKVEQFIGYLNRRGGMRYVQGRPSNRYVAGEGQGAPSNDPEATRRLEELRALGRGDLSSVRKETQDQVHPSGSGEDPRA